MVIFVPPSAPDLGRSFPKPSSSAVEGQTFECTQIGFVVDPDRGPPLLFLASNYSPAVVVVSSTTTNGERRKVWSWPLQRGYQYQRTRL